MIVICVIVLCAASFALVVKHDSTRVLFFFFNGNQWTLSQLSLGKEVMKGLCSFFVLFFVSSFLLCCCFFLSVFIHSVFFLPASFSLSLLSFFFLFTDHLASEVCEIYNSVSGSDCYYSGQYHIMHYAISY